jgi:glycosyltransferase involved in cell wall biosynthesis
LQGRFIFTGLIPPTSIPAHIGIMNTLAHLSLREGLPRALPQALAASVPVVAYDCDGAKEVCLDNETGFLIRPGDLSSLESRIDQLIANEALRRQLGERGREFVKTRFSVETMVESIYALYLKLWNER